MFFKQKWQHFITKYDFDRLVENKKLTTVEEVVDFLYDTKNTLTSSYNIFDHYYKNKSATLNQRLNIIWFSIIFFFFIAPVNYVITGYKGIDERTKFGKWVTKLIGEYKVPKAWGYKGGWQRILSRDEFLIILNENKVDSIHDFKDFIFNDDEDRFCSYLIIENKDVLYKTKIQRLNSFWVYPLLIPVSFIFASYNYIRHGEFVFDRDEKILPVLKKLLGE